MEEGWRGRNGSWSFNSMCFNWLMMRASRQSPGQVAAPAHLRLRLHCVTPCNAAALATQGRTGANSHLVRGPVAAPGALTKERARGRGTCELTRVRRGS
jgi:hypothetical protein